MVEPLQGHHRRDRLFPLKNQTPEIFELFQQHALSNLNGLSSMAEHGMWNVEVLKQRALIVIQRDIQRSD